MFLANAGAGVGKGDPNALLGIIGSCFDVDGAIGHSVVGIFCIGDHIQKYLLQLGWIGLNVRQIFCQIRRESNPLGSGFSFH